MEGFRTEILNYSKSGRKYWVDIEVMPIKGESGEVNGFMAIKSDITVLKTAVQEMLKSENLLQTIMDNAPILVFLKDLEGRYTFFNKTFTKFHPGDYSRKVITDHDLFNPDEANGFQSTDRHIIQTRETLELEQDVVQNGKTDSFYTIKFPLMDDKKNVYAVGGIALRITERKQAEQDRKKLESGQARLDKIVRESYNEIYLFNWDSLRFEFANASALRNIGYTHEELITCKFSDLFSYPDEMALQVLLGPLRRGETDRLQLQIKHSRKDGTYYDVDTLIQVLEKQQSFVAIATDITQKLVTEKKLLATILEKETLIKEIHHRVKNNLQLISSIIYIKMASLKEPEIKYFLQNTRQKIRTISLIHERLLQSETLDKVEISDYLGKLMYDLQTTNARQDLALEIKTNIQEIIIDLDTAIYCGLIANELITNAIKHAFKGRSAGVIEVLFKQVQEEFLLSVSDNGITMPLSVEPGKSGSFGMQLLEIFARQLGGTIEIIREKGTKFQIRF
jgi:PAS domain S-box-containing protein